MNVGLVEPGLWVEVFVMSVLFSVFADEKAIGSDFLRIWNKGFEAAEFQSCILLNLTFK